MATIHLHMELPRPQHNHQKELCVEANQSQKKTKGNPFCLHKGFDR
jgi:hypothetical protein